MRPANTDVAQYLPRVAAPVAIVAGAVLAASASAWVQSSARMDRSPAHAHPTAEGRFALAPDTASHPPVRSEVARPGDLVFRRGTGLLSEAVVEAQGAGRFSHVGVIVPGGDGVEVIHALPPSEGERGGLKRQPLERFVAPERASTAELYRVMGATRSDRRRAIRAAATLFRRSPSFDGAFSLTTSDRIYCTELVWRAWLAGGTDLAAGHTRRLTMPGGEMQVLMPDDLAAHPSLTRVRAFRAPTGGER